MSVFIVPAGTTVVNSGDLLDWIVAEQVPEVGKTSTLQGLKKQMLLGKNEAGFDHLPIEPLSDSDWGVLDSAWLDMPDVADAIQEDWPAYECALEQWKLANSGEAPSWKLVANFVDHVEKAKVQRALVFDEHCAALDALLNASTDRAVMAGHVATPGGLAVQLAIRDAVTYLEQAGFSLAIQQPQPIPEFYSLPGGEAPTSDSIERDCKDLDFVPDAFQIEVPEGNEYRGATNDGCDPRITIRFYPRDFDIGGKLEIGQYFAGGYHMPSGVQHISIFNDQGLLSAYAIAGWVADAELSNLPSAPALISLDKVVLGKRKPLNDEDNKLLLSVFGREFYLQRRWTQEQFLARCNVLSNHKDQPNWELHATFWDPERMERARRNEIQRSQISALDVAIKAGRIQALDGNLTPAQEMGPTVRLDIPNARAYLNPLGIELVLEQSGVQIQLKPDDTKLNDPEVPNLIPVKFAESIVTAFPCEDRPWELIDSEYEIFPGLYLYQQAAHEIAIDQDWSDSRLSDLRQQIAAAISSQELPVRNPKTGGVVSPNGHKDWFVTIADVNDWLGNKYRVEYRWVRSTAAEKTNTSETYVAANFSMLATREQLIDAFGKFTGMDLSWFRALSDLPKLLAARKVSGQGGRGHIAEPYFCPYEVMLWLVDPKRKKGRKLSVDKAWSILEEKFSLVYSQFSIGDPRTD